MESCPLRGFRKFGVLMESSVGIVSAVDLLYSFFVAMDHHMIKGKGKGTYHPERRLNPYRCAAPHTS